MSDEESLSSILSSDTTPVTESVEAAKTEVVPEAKATEQTQLRDEGGKFAKTSEPAKVEAPVEQQKPVEAKKSLSPAEVAAIIDERRKRQALEQELQQLRQQAPQAQKPSVFENEEEAIAARVQEHLAPLREGLFYQSLEIARSKYGDSYSEAEAAFAEASESNPQLIAQLRSSNNPGAFIYSEGLRLKEMADVGGDFLAYREKLTAGHAQALAEKETRISALQAELDALKKQNADLQSLPRSLNKSASAAPKAGEEDDDDIRSIVRFGKKSG